MGPTNRNIIATDRAGRNGTASGRRLRAAALLFGGGDAARRAPSSPDASTSKPIRTRARIPREARAASFPRRPIDLAVARTGRAAAVPGRSWPKPPRNTAFPEALGREPSRPRHPHTCPIPGGPILIACAASAASAGTRKPADLRDDPQPGRSGSRARWQGCARSLPWRRATPPGLSLADQGAFPLAPHPGRRHDPAPWTITVHTFPHSACVACVDDYLGFGERQLAMTRETRRTRPALMRHAIRRLTAFCHFPLRNGSPLAMRMSPFTIRTLHSCITAQALGGFV